MFLPGQSQVTFVLEHLPQATPPTDSIFISGTFNDWAMSKEYVFQKRLDGKLAVTINVSGEFEYKFTRGSWAKAETGKDNAFRPNRRYTGGDDVVEVSILNWQDVAGARSVSIIILYFFAMSFVFLVTRHFLKRLKSPKRTLVNSVIEFQILISIILLGRVAMEILPLEFTHYFLYGGQVILMLCCVSFHDTTARAAGRGTLTKTHFIPTGILLLYLALKTFNITALMFLNSTAVYTLTWDDMFVNSLLLGSVIWHGWKSVRRVKHHNKESKAMSLFLRTNIILAAIFTATFIGLNIAAFTGTQIQVSYDILPFCGSLFVGQTCWFALNRDEVFRIVPTEFQQPEFQELVKSIDNLMRSQKLYLNPNLTLNELADHVGLKPHALSRILNDGHILNFRDFVNSYRVNEFIRLASLASSKRYTFLALAYEVGFNSKSTFNAAFKKNTLMSPREYFRRQKGNALADNDMKSTTL